MVIFSNFKFQKSIKRVKYHKEYKKREMLLLTVSSLEEIVKIQKVLGTVLVLKVML
jgi:hypothetical protein